MMNVKDLDIEWLSQTKSQISKRLLTVETAAKNAVFLKDNQYIQKPISRQTLSKAFKIRSDEIENHSPGSFQIIKRGSLPYIKLSTFIFDEYNKDKCGITNMWRQVNSSAAITNEIGYVSRPIVADIYQNYNLAMKPVLKPKKKRHQYEVSMPNAIWHGDIHDINVGDEIGHLFALIDDYSRFVVGWKILDDKTSLSITRVFQEACANYGAPLTYWSDNGPENKGDLQEYLEEHQILHVFTKPYNPQANGKIERLWKDVEQRLEDCDSIEEAETKIEIFINKHNNNYLHTAIGCIPIERFSEKKPQSIMEPEIRIGRKKRPFQEFVDKSIARYEAYMNKN